MAIHEKQMKLRPQRVQSLFDEWYKEAGFPPLTETVMAQAFRYAFGKGAKWVFDLWELSPTGRNDGLDKS